VLCALAVLQYVAMAEVYSVGGGPTVISSRRVDVPVPNRHGQVFKFPCDDRDSDRECGCIMCRREFYWL
jgi:hypothetical protein